MRSWCASYLLSQRAASITLTIQISRCKVMYKAVDAPLMAIESEVADSLICLFFIFVNKAVQTVIVFW